MLATSPPTMANTVHSVIRQAYNAQPEPPMVRNSRLSPVRCHGLPKSSSTHSVPTGSQSPVHPNTGKVTFRRGFFFLPHQCTECGCPHGWGLFYCAVIDRAKNSKLAQSMLVFIPPRRGVCVEWNRCRKRSGKASQIAGSSDSRCICDAHARPDAVSDETFIGWELGGPGGVSLHDMSRRN